MAIDLDVGDVVLCTVEKIEGTTVFVKIEGNGEGSIIVSEIAPGRIRNLREYVVPKKKIVCKVLRIRKERIELSLRRVTQKERKEVMEEYQKERSYINILKSILQEKADDVIKKISEQERIFDFFQNAKEDPKKLEKIVGKEDAKKILDILKIQKQKKSTLKKEIFLITTRPEGIKVLKGILKTPENVKIKYISAGRYLLETESGDLKKADNLLKESIEKIRKEAKKYGAEFSIKEK
jgi:translation initiation factor 2 subunit 1